MIEGATVYVVDDDDMARESVAALVRSMGVSTEVFRSGEELLSFLGEAPRGCVVALGREYFPPWPSLRGASSEVLPGPFPFVAPAGNSLLG